MFIDNLFEDIDKIIDNMGIEQEQTLYFGGKPIIKTTPNGIEINADGITVAELYAFLKELWDDDNTIIKIGVDECEK